MGTQIKFFNKNKLDLSNINATITVTDTVATNNGQEFVDFMRNRNNTSAWMTTDSDDTANTELLIDFVDPRTLTDLLLVGHNLKAFTIQYWTGLIFVDFPTPIAETVNTASTNHFTFAEVSTSQVKVIIQATQVVDADKQIKQLIMTDQVASGQLVGWPMIKRPTHFTNKKVKTMLSGKVSVVESVGGFGMDLSVESWSEDQDLDLVEQIYSGKRGVLVWISGGDEDQFKRAHIGYRLEDIYVMRAVNDYSPEFFRGIYTNGIKVNLKLRESID